VIVHLASSGQFPHRLAEDVEEERRLFHVAITRARHHAVVVPGPAASPFLRELAAAPAPDERRVTAPAAREATPARTRVASPAEPTTPAGRKAVVLLRALRHDLRAGKPAYTVFSDRTMMAIADALPTTLSDLARVPGIGPAKLEQYGDAVLAAVADALDA
jgi:DNA helicase-2/ATP-dependent DNA helicase PcrA